MQQTNPEFSNIALYRDYLQPKMMITHHVQDKEENCFKSSSSFTSSSVLVHHLNLDLNSSKPDRQENFAIATSHHDELFISSSDDNDDHHVNSSTTLLKPTPAMESVQISPAFIWMAALKVQKVYRSYRTRRRLADSAIVAQGLWWRAIDYAELNHRTISFFNYSKSENISSRWNRVSSNASKLGKGLCLSEDARAMLLAFQHWIEAIDPRHRYGHSLHLYYEAWCEGNTIQPFFYWLDVGDGREVDLKECPRSKLRQQCIKYLGPLDREQYEYKIVGGKIVQKQSGQVLDTTKGSKGAKWIFVMSTSKKLYAGEKTKGKFHHSSFLAGGAALSAGRLVVEDGVLKSISAYSGHYRPTNENLGSFLSFLKEQDANLNDVQIKFTENYENYEESKPVREKSDIADKTEFEPFEFEILDEEKKDGSSEAQKGSRDSYRELLHESMRNAREEMPEMKILKRINSKKAAGLLQLKNQSALKWTTGIGTKTGSIPDYPREFKLKAMEYMNLSPRASSTPSSFKIHASLVSPTLHSTSDISTANVTSVV